MRCQMQYVNETKIILPYGVGTSDVLIAAVKQLMQ